VKPRIAAKIAKLTDSSACVRSSLAALKRALLGATLLDSASSTGRRSVELCPSTASRRRGPSTRPTPSWIGGASWFATADGHAAGVGSGGIGRFPTGIPTISCLTILGEIGKPSDEMAAKCAARWWKATRRTRQCVQAMSYSRAIGHAVP
jgi:hypothetical protein